MSALSRRKGAKWQAELAKRWRDLGLWITARSSQGEQKCRREDKPADIEGTPFSVEAKHRRSCRPLQALEQSEAEAEGRADWRDAIAVCRPHGAAIEDAVVVMRLTTFETLARTAQPRCRESIEHAAVLRVLNDESLSDLAAADTAEVMHGPEVAQ